MVSVTLFKARTPEEYVSEVRSLSDKALLFDHSLLHHWYNKPETAPEWLRNKALIKRLHDIVEKELRRRGFDVNSSLTPVKERKKHAEVKSFREQAEGETIYLEEVTSQWTKPAVLIPEAVRIVGGLAERFETNGDIDVLITLPEDIDALKHIVRFRLGRSLPKDLSKRLEFHDSNLEGFNAPFTSYYAVYDLALIPSVHRGRVELSRTVLRHVVSDEAEKMAEWCAENDEIKPGFFIWTLKASRGYHEGEVYVPEAVINWFRQEDYPLYIQKKYDGFRVLWWKIGDKVVVYSEDGDDLTDRFPTLVQMLKELPVKTVLLDSETEGWRNGKHMGREEISGYAHRHDKPDDSWIVANVFDVLYVDGLPKHHELNAHGDLHKLPYEERLRILEYIASLGKWQSTDETPKTPGFNLVPTYVLEKPDVKKLEKILDKVKNLPGSEGAMIKSAKGEYPLTGLTRTWLKFKKAADVHAVVVEVLPTKKQGIHRLLVGLLIPPGWNVPSDRRREMTLKDGKKHDIAIIGKTFNTDKKVKPGDIVTINFHTAFYYERDGKRWMTVYEPRVYEVRPDQVIPDTLDDFLEVAREASLLQVKQESAISPAWMDDKPHKYVMQHHYRGRTMHVDFRFEVPTSEHLHGITLNDEKRGCIEKPVLTLEQAKKIDWKCTKLSNEPGFYRKLSNRIQAEIKSPEPPEWMNIEGVVPKGDVGATKNYPGVFSIIDRGELFFGAVKPYYVEFFLNGGKFTGRWVLRKLPNPWGEEPAFIWLFWKPIDQMPYVLSSRAVKQRWMPPEKISALPPEIREQIPEKYRYWLYNGEEARRVRDELVEKIRQGEVQIRLPKKWMGVRGRTYVYAYQFWRGPIVVRKGPSRERWILCMDDECYASDEPIDEYATLTRLEKITGNMIHPGPVNPGTFLNETKDTPSFIQVLGRGTYDVLIDKPLVRKIKFTSGPLTGMWLWTREDPNIDLWIAERVEESPNAE